MVLCSSMGSVVEVVQSQVYCSPGFAILFSRSSVPLPVQRALLGLDLHLGLGQDEQRLNVFSFYVSPSLSLSLSVSLTPSLPLSLPHSLSPSLSRSLSVSRTPSLYLSLTSSLPLSLAPCLYLSLPLSTSLLGPGELVQIGSTCCNLVLKRKLCSLPKASSLWIFLSFSVPVFCVSLSSLSLYHSLSNFLALSRWVKLSLGTVLGSKL